MPLSLLQIAMFVVHAQAQDAEVQSPYVPSFAELTGGAEFVGGVEDLALLADQAADVDVVQDDLSAGFTDSDGLIADVPWQADVGVYLSNGNDSLLVDLPGASERSEATPVAYGLNVYEDEVGGSNIAVQNTEVGATFFAEIVDANGPTEFPFALTLPVGGWIEDAGDGGFLIYAETGEVHSVIDPAYAYAADGQAVPAYYTLEGDVLVLHVEHDGTQIYPILADPKISIAIKVVKVIRVAKYATYVSPVSFAAGVLIDYAAEKILDKVGQKTGWW